MHDHKSGFLRRTTDVKDKFPDDDFSHSANLSWEDLQSLNAGEWFLKVRATHTHSLTEVCVIVLQSQEVSSDFPDRSFPLSVQSLRRGGGNGQKSDHTLLTAAPQPRRAAQHLSDI